MKIVVASCFKYRDAWPPFFQLFRKFWPDCPYPIALLTDRHSGEHAPDEATIWLSGENATWCGGLAAIAKSEWLSGSDLMLFQEDFLLNAPVNTSLVKRGSEILQRDNVGAVRLYPCPGATELSDDEHFGRVARHSQYRNSLQVTLYRSEYLRAIASRFNTPSEFELQGSPWASQHLSAEVWAFKRSVQPWPIQYYCSAISRALWEPDALEFCRQQGITVDTSLRGIRKTESDAAFAAN